MLMIEFRVPGSAFRVLRSGFCVPGSALSLFKVQGHPLQTAYWLLPTIKGSGLPGFKVQCSKFKEPYFVPRTSYFVLIKLPSCPHFSRL